MTVRRRSTNTRMTTAFVDGVDKHGVRFSDFRPVEMLAPISDAHGKRGERLRRARIDARLSLRDLVEMTGLANFTVVELSQAQAGTLELSEDEWAALYRALGQEETADE